VRRWPALDVRSASPDLVLAFVDDYSPSAAEERPDGLRLYFSSTAARDAAGASLLSLGYASMALDVDDEDWARRSQEALPPIQVGRFVVMTRAASGSFSADAAGRTPLIVEPSMGFGTGHHATTRLCLLALQSLPLHGVSVLDVGTGSGILAIAAAKMGAARAIGIDNDPDAIASAEENLALNSGVSGVEFRVADLADLAALRLEPADVLIANLTGAVLIRESRRLSDAATARGVLVLSGVLADEEPDVVRAFCGRRLVHRSEEGEWVCLTLEP
jgi:ribosomal protein L11 methyltransferase